MVTELKSVVVDVMDMLDMHVVGRAIWEAGGVQCRPEIPVMGAPATCGCCIVGVNIRSL